MPAVLTADAQIRFTRAVRTTVLTIVADTEISMNTLQKIGLAIVGLILLFVLIGMALEIPL